MEEIRVSGKKIWEIYGYVRVFDYFLTVESAGWFDE